MAGLGPAPYEGGHYGLGTGTGRQPRHDGARPDGSFRSSARHPAANGEPARWLAATRTPLKWSAPIFLGAQPRRILTARWGAHIAPIGGDPIPSTRGLKAHMK